MQKCKKCDDKLGYKNKLRSLFSGYSPIICKGCGSKYYVPFYTRIICAFLIGLPVLLMNHYLWNVFSEINAATSVGCYLIWCALVTLVYPFWTRYYMKD